MSPSNPTRRDDGIHEMYGQHCYRAMAVATIEATVLDAADSIFLPAHYTLGDVVVHEGKPFALTELVSYEGLYCQAVDPRDRIVAHGVVEQVDDASCRLVVGAAGHSDGGFLRLFRAGSRSTP